MRLKLILVLLVFSAVAKAQSGTPELITDRPDQTESAVVVPHRYLQIESGFLFANRETDQTTQKLYAYNATLLRYGLLANFELRLGMDYLGEKATITNTDTTTNISGFSPLYAGFKVKIAEEDGWKPEMAFLGGLVLPFTASSDFKPEHTSSTMRFAFAHTLSDRFSLGYNIGALWNGASAIPIYFYSLSLGAGITNKLGAFIESYGYLPEKGDAQHLVDAGLTYLLRPNFQLDISGGMGLQNMIDNFISVGLTYRLPN